MLPDFPTQMVILCLVCQQVALVLEPACDWHEHGPAGLTIPGFKAQWIQPESSAQ